MGKLLVSAYSFTVFKYILCTIYVDFLHYIFLESGRPVYKICGKTFLLTFYGDTVYTHMHLFVFSFVDQPTRGANTLSCNVGSQKRYHLAIIAYSGSQPIDLNKKRTILQHRPRPMLPFWLYLTRTGTMLSMQQTHKLLLAYFMLVFCRCCLVGYFLSIFLICVL